VINALDFMRQLDPKDEDYQSKVNEFILEFPSAITDPRVKAILGNKNSINATVSQAREKINESRRATEQKTLEEQSKWQQSMAAAGATNEEIAMAEEGGFDPVQAARALADVKKRTESERGGSRDQSRQEAAVLRLEEEKAGLQAELNLAEEAGDDAKAGELRSKIASVEARIGVRGRQEEPTTDTTPTQSGEVFTLEEMKERHEKGEAKAGDRFYNAQGAVMTYTPDKRTSTTPTPNPKPTSTTSPKPESTESGEDNQPVMEVSKYGTKRWYLNGELHREDGPALEYADGNKYWFLNDKLHREDGPAVERADGTKKWYLNGEEMTEKEFNKWRKENKK
jgi:hypothetical protein